MWTMLESSATRLTFNFGAAAASALLHIVWAIDLHLVSRVGTGGAGHGPGWWVQWLHLQHLPDVTGTVPGVSGYGLVLFGPFPFRL